MKPIETIYKGYRFRSRLEARWAVFFDAIGLQFEYEKEGYKVAGGLYLPDFYIPAHDCFIEIKAEDPLDRETFSYIDKRLENFSKEKLLVVFFGLPGENYGRWYGFDLCNSGGGISMWDEMQWAYNREDEMVCITTNNGRNDRSYCSGPEWESTKFIVGRCEEEDWGISVDHRRIANGFSAAKQARFEHGEHGVCL